MSKIKFMTDSASDISIEDEKRLGIRVLSFPIAVDGKNLKERVDFTTKEFYDILKNAQEIPVTAQITQFDFLKLFKEYYEKKYTDIIFVSINSRGSSTYNNSVLARKEFYEKYPEAKNKISIHLLDSKAYTAAYGYAVMQAAEKAKKGMPVNEILAYLRDWMSTAKIYFATYSLRFAKKSGRISAAAAFMGELLGLRPIMTFVDGKSAVVEKVRGEKAVVPAILDLAEKIRVPHTPYVLLVGSHKEGKEQLIKEAEKRFGQKPEDIFYLGAAITINSGPETVGIVVKTSSKQ